MKKVKNCNLCGNNKFELFEKYSWKGKSFNFVKCNNCDLLFLNPMPAEKESKVYYGEEYRARYSKKWTYNPFKKMLMPLFKILFRARISRKPFDRFLLVAFFPFTLRLEKTLCREGLLGINRTGKVLDVGCSFGSWMSFMEELGFKAYGCDTDKKCAKFAQKEGLKVKNYDVLHAKYPSAFFDLVAFRDVLEHTHDPIKNLKEARRIVKEDGFLLIRVPNNISSESKRFSRPEDVPYHNYSFTEKTIKNYLEKVGFALKELYPISFGPSLIAVAQPL
jgi:SAM-dependent methyltransferase